MTKRNGVVILAVVLLLTGLSLFLKQPSDKGSIELTKQLLIDVKEGNMEHLQANMKNYKKVINQTEDNWTALDIAFIYERPEIALLLYNNGAETSEPIQFLAVNYLTMESETDDAFELLKKVIENEAEQINRQNEHGNTLLHIAIEKGDINLLELLITHGADAAIQNDKKRNALLTAVFFNQIEVTNLLNDKYPGLLKEVDLYKNTALHLAVENGSKDMVSFLIEANSATMDEMKKVKNNDGLTALDYAMQWHNDEIINLLK